MSLRQLLKEDLRNHGGDWTLPGFRAVAVHRFGRWCMHGTTRRARLLRPLYWMLYRRVRNVYGIELPWSVQLGRNVVFEHQGGIVIHGLATIGDGCVIRQGVTLGNRTKMHKDDAPQLGEDVDVGAGAKVLGSILVGDEAIIGANAVVLDDVKSRTTVAGIPVRVVTDRARYKHANDAAQPTRATATGESEFVS
jgi:serine O-acetyltransferase